MPGPVFFNTSSACLRQPDERCRPACTNRLPAYTVRLVRLCSRHRLFTELALDTHTHGEKEPRSKGRASWVSYYRLELRHGRVCVCVSSASSVKRRCRLHKRTSLTV